VSIPNRWPLPLAFCGQGEQGHQSEHDQGGSEARHVGSGWQSRERGERNDGRVRVKRGSCGCECEPLKAAAVCRESASFRHPPRGRLFQRWVGLASDWSRLGAGSVSRLCCSGSNTIEPLNVKNGQQTPVGPQRGGAGVAGSDVPALTASSHCERPGEGLNICYI
jgi:hypothetical protein